MNFKKLTQLVIMFSMGVTIAAVAVPCSPFKAPAPSVRIALLGDLGSPASPAK